MAPARQPDPLTPPADASGPLRALPDRLLVVSASARMLVESAARAGIAVVALDQYADADTRALARHAEAIPTDENGFLREHLLARAASLAPAGEYPLVYGGGLDSRPELLRALARDRLVLGNPPAILERFRDPRWFFGQLRAASIAYPETRFEHPATGANWLIKAGCSEGGKRVRFCAHDRAGPGEYYQKQESGRPCSALFLADGENVRLIGLNTLWHSAARGSFLFEGALNRAPLSRRQRGRIETAIAGLVRRSGLRGLNTLDFLVAPGREPRILEVNTRPGATLSLHDPDFPEGLLAAHVVACGGRLPDDAGRIGPVRAFRVMMAPADLSMGEHFSWPDWCSDRPAPGTRVVAGAPFCTVRAEGESARDVVRRLQARLLALRRRFVC